MAEKLTKEQKMAVTDRGGKLLVSAAAGSGKTKVLVDRLLSYLMDPVAPANLDEFLIITYTKAAASELRGKIASKLSEKMTEAPDNKHLQKQMQRLYLTKISTVHSFCGDVLREYAYLLDLPADFRVADENECRQLRDSTMARLLDNAYQNSNDEDFCAFVDTQGLGRDDRLVPEILFKVYDSARCHMEPDEWLQRCIDSAETDGLTDAGQTPWGKYLMEELFIFLDMQIDALEFCAREAAQTETMEKPTALLESTVVQLRQLRSCKTWDEIVKCDCVDFGRLLFSKKCPDLELTDRIKAVRNACKKGLEKRMKAFFDVSCVVFEDLEQSAGAVRGMVKLVRQFNRDYDRAKRSRRILDFGDLEHRMLDLLLGKSRTGPTAAAGEIGARFREIMVDEYQDSNEVQDKIFETLTMKRHNCFMVGDVKQSIYQFRLADPQIFINKYDAYVPAGEARTGQGRKIMLSANFRSGGAVLAGINDVFDSCMSRRVGGLDYGPDESLKEGIPHEPLGEPEVELWAIPVEESTYEEEAAFVAERICQLTDGTHFVRQGEQLRPIHPEDVTILLRSPGSVGGYFKEALAARGIRCTSGGGDDLLQTQEVMVLRAILETISNPRQDIPLITALSSPVFCVTADELAELRSGNRTGSFYDVLLQSNMPKIQNFLGALAIWRREARLQPLAQLLESVFAKTRMDSIYAAMENGTVRRENLQAFYQLAVDFEKTGHRDLEQFLNHIGAMDEKGLTIQGEQNNTGMVTLMSIHKSKGLEFPVVFVCGLSREFNRESTRAQVLCDQILGLGLTAVDKRNRVRYPTIAKRAIAAKMTADSISEEMRVLYVALTRASDRLIMTYASQTLPKDIQEIALRMDVGHRELLTQDAVCSGEWVLMAALRRTESGELFALGGRPRETKLGQPQWLVRVQPAPQVRKCDLTEQIQRDPIPERLLQQLEQMKDFSYAHVAATQAPSKQTATQRKGREKDEEVAQNAPVRFPCSRTWRRPSFVEETLSGADLGTATHNVMHYIRYDRCDNVSDICGELERLVQEDLLTQQQADAVDVKRIWSFFASPLGQRLRTSENVLREFKFSILDDGSHYGDGLEGEKVLLQGVVDCAIVEDDGITVIDFKTDFVTETTLPEKVAYYRPQVMTYADALSRIYKKNVKSAQLYFFRMDRFVTL